MGKRVVGGAAAIGVAAVVVVLALVLTGGGDGGPRALPVLGAAGGAAETADEAAATSMSPAGRSFGDPGYDFTGGDGGLLAEADAWSLDAADGEARAAALAEALGLGDLIDNGVQWTAQGPDGFLTVDRQPGLPWYYSASLAEEAVGGIATTPPPGDTPVSSDGTVSSDGSPPTAGQTQPRCGVQTSCAPPSAGGCEGGDGDAVCTAPAEPTCWPDGGCTETGSAGGGTDGRPGVGCTPPADDTGDADPVTSCVAPTFDCAVPECPPGAACIQACPEPGPDAVPVPMPEPSRPDDLPSAEEAEVIARDLLANVGTDLTGAETRVDDGFTTWAFVSDPVVGGLPTFGMTSAVGVGSGGRIEYANGWLDEASEGDTYPLVGVDVALERLAEGAGGWFAYAPSEPVDCAHCDELRAPEPTVLDTVRVGLQLVPAYGVDEAWLVPSYLFTIEGGGPGAVVAAFAIADDLLAPPVEVEEQVVDPPEGEPEPAPAPVPGTAGGAPGEVGDIAVLEPGQRAEIGVTYYLDISTHCGVTGIDFDGRRWDAAPPLGNGSAPEGWAEPTEGGGITLASPDEAEFVGDTARTKVARFLPRPADAGDPPGCE